jgi:hypothetical protein
MEAARIGAEVMPEGAESTDRSWLVEPLGPHDVRIHVDLGDSVEISEEARAALEGLLDQLQESEVEGLDLFCPSLRSCGNYFCDLGKCLLSGGPCFVEVFCKIRPYA